MRAEHAELAALQAGAPPLLLTTDLPVVRLSPTAEPLGTFELCCPPDQLRPLAFEVRARVCERELPVGLGETNPHHEHQTVGSGVH